MTFYKSLVNFSKIAFQRTFFVMVTIRLRRGPGLCSGGPTEDLYPSQLSEVWPALAD